MIAYLVEHKYAPSTVKTYVSALGYFHKLRNLPDPAGAFIIVQMLRGYGKTGMRADTRLPITLPVLHKILMTVPQLSGPPYNICLFKSMCLFAFYAFARVGEITLSESAGNIIHLHQLSLLLNAHHNVEAFKITFLNYKHSYNNGQFSLTIHRQENHCPVASMLEYLSIRGKRPGPLFLSIDGNAIPRSVFTSLLSRVIKLCGLDPSRYKSHSFRIGAASHAADKGMSDAQIRALGRWKSNAFMKYIRLQSVST